jgi:hypothetical protein
MKYCTGPSDAWARLVYEIVTARSRRALLRVTLLVMVCTPGIVAVAIVLLFR